MKKIAVILAGCGSMDGSEIHEATFTLVAIDELNAQYECFALDKPQARVMNFVTGQEEVAETRNQLKEAARIARGKIKSIDQIKVAEFDALVFPGGFGTAFNLCSFAKDASNGIVEPEIAQTLRDFYNAKKPIGAICIAPVIVALILGKEIQPTLTMGDLNDPAGKELEKLNCKILACATKECVVDTKNKIVTTPAYMNAKRISDVREGIYKLISEVLKLTI
jgi:enhancing lycopene biosynthesis protein 2